MLRFITSRTHTISNQNQCGSIHSYTGASTRVIKMDHPFREIAPKKQIMAKNHFNGDDTSHQEWVAWPRCETIKLNGRRGTHHTQPIHTKIEHRPNNRPNVYIHASEEQRGEKRIYFQINYNKIVNKNGNISFIKRCAEA